MIFKRKDNKPYRRRSVGTTQPMTRKDTTNSTSTNSAFRRNQVMNTYRGKSAITSEESARKRTHELNIFRRRISVALTVVVILVGLTAFILGQFTSSVSVRATIDGQSVNLNNKSQLYEEAINKYYAQNPFERLRFLQRTDALISFIRQVAPEIGELESIDASGFPSNMTLNVTARKPVAEWSQNDKTFYVDGAGQAFEVNYYEPPSLVIVDENDMKSQDGAAVASNRFLQVVGRLVTEIDIRKLSVEKIIIPRGTVREVDIILKGNSIVFKLSVDRSPAAQAEDIARVNRYFSERGELPVYVDIRVEQKAFYK